MDRNLLSCKFLSTFKNQANFQKRHLFFQSFNHSIAIIKHQNYTILFRWKFFIQQKGILLRKTLFSVSFIIRYVHHSRLRNRCPNYVLGQPLQTLFLIWKYRHSAININSTVFPSHYIIYYKIL